MRHSCHELLRASFRECQASGGSGLSAALPFVRHRLGRARGALCGVLGYPRISGGAFLQFLSTTHEPACPRPKQPMPRVPRAPAAPWRHCCCNTLQRRIAPACAEFQAWPENCFGSAHGAIDGGAATFSRSRPAAPIAGTCAVAPLAHLASRLQPGSDARSGNRRAWSGRIAGRCAGAFTPHSKPWRAGPQRTRASPCRRNCGPAIACVPRERPDGDSG